MCDDKIACIRHSRFRCSLDSADLGSSISRDIPRIETPAVLGFSKDLSLLSCVYIGVTLWTTLNLPEIRLVYTKILKIDE